MINKKSFFLISVILLLISFKYISSQPGLAHFFNSIAPKVDLYKSIVQDNFNLSEKGFNRIYKLNAKYHDIYQISFYSDTESIPIDYIYKGRLLIELYNDIHVLESVIVEKPIAYFGSENKRDRYKEFSMYEFPIPYKGNSDNLYVKITVLEPDAQISKLDKSVQIRVAVSGRP